MTTLAATDFALDLKHVAKTYKGKIHALRGIEMRVHRGEVFGLLGPNGAGKSTLVKILMSVIHPSRCDGTMLGRRVGEKGVLARVGYLPEHHRFPEYLTGAQVVDYFGALAGVPRRERRSRGPGLLELVGMKAWGGKRVRQFSKGMRQRIGIAQALINNPDLVLLDEPTDGVDPVGRRDIREVLLRLKSEGKTVFVNSHLLSELEMVCDRVAILVQGSVAAAGTIDELTRDQQRYEIELDLEAGEAMHRAARAALPEAPQIGPPIVEQHHSTLAERSSWSGTLSTGEAFSITARGIRLGTSDAKRVQPVIDRLRAAGVTIVAVRPMRPSLEDLFMRAVTDPTTGAVLSPGASGEGARP
jgi:ABC-2 type transport system ATP-binding protein